jgi:hypothetical protein
MQPPIRTSSKPTIRADHSAGGSLEITVLHTNAGATSKAIQTAAQLTKGLAADIRLLVLQVVPYPLPLETPDVPLEFTRQRFLEMASHANVEVRVDIRVGRDRHVLLESALNPASVVLIGGKRGWWPTPESRVTRLLKRLGCQVVPTGSE